MAKHYSPVSKKLTQQLESARDCVDIIEPNMAAVRLDLWLVLDVSEPSEVLHGYLPFALNIPHGQLEFKISQPPYFDRLGAVLLYSNNGRRSMLGGLTLIQLGFTNAHSLAGGMTKWKALDLPLE